MDTLIEDPNCKMTITKSCDGKSLHKTIRYKRGGLLSGLQDICDAPTRQGEKGVNSAHQLINWVPLGQSVMRIALSLLLLICLWIPAELRAAEVTLAWDPISDDGLSGYRVYTRQAEETYGNQPAWIGTTSTCTINDLNDNISYCFIVRALNINGIESDSSNEVCLNLTTDEAADDPAESSSQDAEDDTDGDGMPDDWESEMGLDPEADDSDLDSDGDAISNLDEYENGSDPSEPADNIPPSTPTGKEPTAGVVVDSLTPQLVTEPYEDLDSYNGHSKTQWKIVRVYDGLCVFDSKSKKHLTKFTVPSWVLEAETEYYWKVRFFDKLGAASPWSDKNRFETSLDFEDRDGNGVLDDQEVADEQDLNGDGIPDTMQPDTIKCVNGGNGDGVLGIGIKGQQKNALISGASNGNPEEFVRSLRDPDSLPYGIFEYKIEVEKAGDTAQITIFFPTPAEDGAGWYQLGIETDWIDYSEHAQFSSDRKSVTLELKDGGYGDIDGTENSVIVDRSGLMSISQSTSGITGSSSLDWGGSDSCFINGAKRSNEVKKFYLWLAVAGFAMMVLSKVAAIWYEKLPKAKKAQ